MSAGFISSSTSCFISYSSLIDQHVFYIQQYQLKLKNHDKFEENNSKDNIIQKQ